MDFTGLLEKAPELGVILIIVIAFLKALKSRDCTLKDIADRCHELRSDATEAMRENSKIIGENTGMLREAVGVLRTMNGKR